MACMSILLWIQSRQQFVGEVDFGGILIEGDVKELLNEYSVEDETCSNEDIEESVDNGTDADGGKISKDAAFMHDEDPVNPGGPPVLANSLLNFVMTGLTKRFSSFVGCWLVARLTGRQLFFLCMHVIKKIEEIGFKVDLLVGDNAKVNVKLFKLLKRRTDEEEIVVTHPVDQSRKLFLSFDYTHILKNIRNQMIDRPLKWNGNHINFSLITLLFQKTIDGGLALCRFLTRRHVDPKNFERMKVNYARDIFRPEVDAALRSMHDLQEPGFENVEKLVSFIEFIWRWYNYYDVCNLTQH